MADHKPAFLGAERHLGVHVELAGPGRHRGHRDVHPLADVGFLDEAKPRRERAEQREVRHEPAHSGGPCAVRGGVRAEVGQLPSGHGNRSGDGRFEAFCEPPVPIHPLGPGRVTGQVAAGCRPDRRQVVRYFVAAQHGSESAVRTGRQLRRAHPRRKAGSGTTPSGALPIFSVRRNRFTAKHAATLYAPIDPARPRPGVDVAEAEVHEAVGQHPRPLGGRTPSGGVEVDAPTAGDDCPPAGRAHALALRRLQVEPGQERAEERMPT